MNYCVHSHQIVYFTYTNCIDCGSLLSSPDNSYVVKDHEYDKRVEVSTSQLYLNVIKKDKVYKQPKHYIENRKCFIDWLKYICNQLHISKRTLHISVAYMDSILSQKNYPKERLYLIVLTCLIVATKYCELDTIIPSYKEFIRAAATTLPLHKLELKKSEAEVLHALSWNLKVNTPLIIAELLLTQGVLTTSDQTFDKKPVNENTAKIVTRETINYVERALSGMFNIK